MSGHDPVKVPADFWDRADVVDVLRRRDIGALFRLLRKHSGVSQLRIAMTIGMTPARVGEVSRGRRSVVALSMFERVADSLVMPDHARVVLGIAPSLPGTSTQRRDEESMATRRPGGSMRRRVTRLVERLRAAGWSRVQIAGVIRERFGVNPRVALRLAHGWSQQQVADEWNWRWPDDPKTHEALSRWEVWPAETGHAPPFGVLARLAELYQCVVSDLVADLPDFRHLDGAGLCSGAGGRSKP